MNSTMAVIEALERGTTPWQKPWSNEYAAAMQVPYNMVRQNRYRGGNVVQLWGTALERGYEDPRWCTYKQAEEKGWQVRAGERGVVVEYVKMPDERRAPGDEATPEDREERNERRRPGTRIRRLRLSYPSPKGPLVLLRVRPRHRIVEPELDDDVDHEKGY